MNENKILSALIAGRDNYELVEDHVNSDDFSPLVKLVYEEICGYYQTDPEAKEVDIEILSARLERCVPNPKHAQAVLGIVKSLPDVSGANVVRELLDIKAQACGMELVQAVAGGKPTRDVRVLVDKYAQLLDKEDLENTNEEIVGLKVGDLVTERNDPKNIIQIAPKALNDRLDGGARAGHHILVFAPTEMGKTGFAINLLAHFLKQGLRTLYIGNEDPAKDIIFRAACRVTKRDKFNLERDPDAAQKVLDESGWDNFVFADLAPGTFPRIQRLVKKYLPRVVILDQLGNINVNTSRNESKTGSLEQAAKEARGIAKRNGVLVVSLSQAADSATGRSVLGRGDVHNSNVGIPGQVDLMLGIGADEHMEARGLREITLIKNKISGNHDHFTVQYFPATSTFQ